jgi:hypothetical protein
VANDEQLQSREATTWIVWNCRLDGKFLELVFWPAPRMAWRLRVPSVNLFLPGKFPQPTGLFYAEHLRAQSALRDQTGVVMPRKKTSSSPDSPTASAAAAAAAQTSKVTSIESRPSAPAHSHGDAHAIEEHIRHRAYELFEQRGRHDGLADQDWLRAEAELRAAAGKRSA